VKFHSKVEEGTKWKYDLTKSNRSLSEINVIRLQYMVKALGTLTSERERILLIRFCQKIGILEVTPIAVYLEISLKKTTSQTRSSFSFPASIFCLPLVIF